MRKIIVSEYKAVGGYKEVDVEYTWDDLRSMFNTKSDIIFHLMNEIERLEKIIKDKLGIE